MKITTFIFVLVVMVSACHQDPCKKTDCGEWGTCMEGACVCEEGYQTDPDGACTVAIRSKFLGTWKVMDTCSVTSTQNYFIAATEIIGNINTIKINPFWAAFTNPVTATISKDSVLIKRQEPDGNDFFIAGAGMLTVVSGDTIINFDYKVTLESDPDDILTDDCGHSVWVKQ